MTIRYLGVEMSSFNVTAPRIVNSLQVEERERRKKNYDALRVMMVAITGSDEWDAYTYSELIEGAQNVLASEAQRIR